MAYNLSLLIIIIEVPMHILAIISLFSPPATNHLSISLCNGDRGPKNWHTRSSQQYIEYHHWTERQFLLTKYHSNG